MAQVVSYPPLDQPITQVHTPKHGWEQFNPSGLVSKVWEYFFRWVQALVNVAPQVVGTVALTLQAASIGATSIPATFPTLPNTRLLPGLYEIQYYIRVTRPASTSSSILFTVGWTDGTVACTASSATASGNTTATVLTGPPLLVRVDSATNVTYATTYTSVGGTTMQYRLDVRLIAIPVPA